MIAHRAHQSTRAWKADTLSSVREYDARRRRERCCLKRDFGTVPWQLCDYVTLILRRCEGDETSLYGPRCHLAARQEAGRFGRRKRTSASGAFRTSLMSTRL